MARVTRVDPVVVALRLVVVIGWCDSESEVTLSPASELTPQPIAGRRRRTQPSTTPALSETAITQEPEERKSRWPGWKGCQGASWR